MKEFKLDEQIRSWLDYKEEMINVEDLKQKLHDLKEGLKDDDKFMILQYNLSIKIAKDENEKVMWKHRREGWELAVEEFKKKIENGW